MQKVLRLTYVPLLLSSVMVISNAHGASDDSTALAITGGGDSSTEAGAKKAPTALPSQDTLLNANLYDWQIAKGTFQLLPSEIHFEEEFTADNIKAFTTKPDLDLDLGTFKILKKAGFKSRQPNDEQISVIRGVITANKKLVIVEGVPGAGKTSGVLKWVVGFIRGVTPERKIYLSAPNEGGMKAVHGDFKDENDSGAAKILPFEDMMTGTSLEDGAFVIVDECYMMTKTQLNALLKTGLKKNWQVLLTGDSLQNLPPENSIFGFLGNFPTFNLSQSFRSTNTVERNFANRVLKAFSNPQSQSRAINEGLKYLNITREDVLLRLGDLGPLLVECRNLFVGLDQDAQADAAIAGMVNMALYDRATYDTSPSSGPKGTIMMVVHGDDKPQINTALLKKGLLQDQINQILKTSAESQGAAATSVFVLFNKKMTQSEIYVALTRHKEKLWVIAPIGKNEKSFNNLEEAINYPYVSDQIKLRALLKFRNAVKKVLAGQRWMKQRKTPASTEASIGG